MIAFKEKRILSSMNYYVETCSNTTDEIRRIPISFYGCLLRKLAALTVNAQRRCLSRCRAGLHMTSAAELGTATPFGPIMDVAVRVSEEHCRKQSEQLGDLEGFLQQAAGVECG